MKYKLNKLKKMFFIAAGFFVCASFATSLSAYFISRVDLSPKITLLGVNHPLKSFDIEQEHLEALLTDLSAKTEPYFIFVEDPFNTLNRPLKKLESGYIKHHLLPGLIERINALKNSNLHVFSIERRFSLYKALDFFNPLLIPPFFGANSPEKINKNIYMNSYSFTFEQLIQEIVQRRNELDARRSFCANIPNAGEFIDAMIEQIDKDFCLLVETLHANNIQPKASILYTAIDLFLTERLRKAPYQEQEIEQLRIDLNQFMLDYPDGMDKTIWKQRKETLIGRILDILVKPITDSISQSVHDQLYQCLLRLGLLIVDSHAVLDVLQYSEKDKIIVIAGDLHIRNMKQYIPNLGREVISSIQKNEVVPLSLSNIVI